MEHGPADLAAQATIAKLALNDENLKLMRKRAIDETLGIRRRGRFSLDLIAAKKRLNKLDRDEQGAERLEPFCFVLKQVLRKHITQVESARRSQRKGD